MPFKKIIFSLILLFISPLFLTACQSQTKFVTLTVNHQTIKAELARTSLQHIQGLSNRQSLPANQGMLFVFNKHFKPSFWMKDMRFPLDIIWISDGLIVDITSNISPPQPNQPLKHYSPTQPVNYVLELNAGWAAEHNLKIGDRVEGLPST